MRILLIKPKHIGDTLILTPTIVAIKQAYPLAEIWVLVRRGCEGILAGCPEITRVLTLAGVEKSERQWGDTWRQLQTIRQLWSITFDYVFELGDGHRARFFAQRARTKNRISVRIYDSVPVWQTWGLAPSKYDWKTSHRVEKDYYTVHEFLRLPRQIPPLRFAPELTQAWSPGDALTNFIVLQMGSRQGFNLWPKENWREMAMALLERVENVVVTGGPVASEIADAQWLQEQLGERIIPTRGQANWAQVAGLLHRARLYVGPSTATLHLAAACGCPVVGVFGPTIEDHWHPWQVPYRIVTSPDYASWGEAEERFARIRQRSTRDVPAADVVKACVAMLEG